MSRRICVWGQDFSFFLKKGTKVRCYFAPEWRGCCVSGGCGRGREGGSAPCSGAVLCVSVFYRSSYSYVALSGCAASCLLSPLVLWRLSGPLLFAEFSQSWASSLPVSDCCSESKQVGWEGHLTASCALPLCHGILNRLMERTAGLLGFCEWGWFENVLSSIIFALCLAPKSRWNKKCGKAWSHWKRRASAASTRQRKLAAAVMNRRGNSTCAHRVEKLVYLQIVARVIYYPMSC